MRSDGPAVEKRDREEAKEIEERDRVDKETAGVDSGYGARRGRTTSNESRVSPLNELDYRRSKRGVEET